MTAGRKGKDYPELLYVAMVIIIVMLVLEAFGFPAFHLFRLVIDTILHLLRVAK